MFSSVRFGSLELDSASMAELPESSSFSRLETLLWAAKLVFILFGFISTVFLVKVAVIPYAFKLFLSTLPTIWISLESWFSPPFLYIIVHFIIFIIVISSFSPNQSKPQSSDDKSSIAVETPALKHKLPDLNLSEDLKMAKEEEKQMVLDFPAMSNETAPDSPPEGLPKEYFFPDHGEVEEGVEQASAADSDDEDSLEATWQSIMEGKGKDERHLKKSQTFGTPAGYLGRANGYGVDGVEDPVAWAKRELRKSDTFTDRVSYKREKWMSQEELKKQSEEFINKINADMRLQRLESAQRFLRRHRCVNGINADNIRL